MKLISCHVENFGRLSNININFNEGINIINEPNGWGKSTMAAFFRAMLYGFDNKKEPGAFEKERKLYLPWQGGAYGGTLDIEIGGKAYRITRVFGNTEKHDTFSLIDLDTNLESGDYTDKIGEELFELDSASFKRSVYIAQNDIVATTTDAIHAKLGNLVENTNDINNFENAQAEIKNMINSLSPGRITGSIKKRANAIAQLEYEIQSYEAIDKSMEELNLKIEEKRRQKKELQEIRQDYAKALRIASEDSRKQELKKSYEELIEDLKVKEDSYKAIKSKLPASFPDEAELEEQAVKARELEKQQITEESLAFTADEVEKFDVADAMFADHIPSDVELDEMLAKVSNINKVKGEHGQLEMKLSQMESVAMLTDQEPVDEFEKSAFSPIGIVFLILGILVGGVSAVMLLAKLMAGFKSLFIAGAVGGAVVAAVGIVFIIVGARINKKNTKELIRRREEHEASKKAKEEPILEMKTQLEAITSGIDILEQEVQEFLEKYGIKYDINSSQSKLYDLKAKAQEYNRLLEKKNKRDKAVEESARLMTEFKEFGSKYSISMVGEIANIISELKGKITECRLLQRSYEASLEKKKQFEAQHDVESILSPVECPYSLEELNNMIRDVEKGVEDIQQGIDQYSRQIEDLQEQLDQKAEKEQELDNALVMQEEEKHKYEILELTRDFLQTAKEQFTSRYMAPIADSFQKYYGIMTGDESRNWMVDANISFKLKEHGEYRDVKWLSAGYKDLIGLCMRFALVDAMYKDEKPFLILDDPFVNLDDERASHGKQLLIALEEDYQAIYFTCHESREYQA